MGFKKFYENEKMKYKVYLDMDGCITDFIKGFNTLSPDKTYDEWKKEGNEEEAWKLIHNEGKDFWSNLNWTEDGKILWNFVKQFNPIILSSPGITNVDVVEEGKNEWLDKELGKNIPRIIKKDKEKYANENSILIDDTKNNINKWVESNGIGILYVNVEDTINQLKNIGIKESLDDIFDSNSKPIKNFDNKKFFNTKKLRKRSRIFDFL